MAVSTSERCSFGDGENSLAAEAALSQCIQGLGDIRPRQGQGHAGLQPPSRDQGEQRGDIGANGWT